MGVVVFNPSEIATPIIIIMISSYDFIDELKRCTDLNVEQHSILDNIKNEIILSEEARLEAGGSMEAFHAGMIIEIALILQVKGAFIDKNVKQTTIKKAFEVMALLMKA